MRIKTGQGSKEVYMGKNLSWATMSLGMWQFSLYTAQQLLGKLLDSLKVDIYALGHGMRPPTLSNYFTCLLTDPSSLGNIPIVHFPGKWK